MTKPSDIKIRVPFTDTFGKVEAEYLAVFIVLFLREHGDTFENAFVWGVFSAWVVSTYERDMSIVGSAFRNPMWSPSTGLQHLEQHGHITTMGVGSEKILRAHKSFVDRLQPPAGSGAREGAP